MKHKQREDLIEIRRKYVIDYLAQGLSQRDIASHLKCSVTLINKDIKYLRERAKHDIHRYTNEVLPHEVDIQLAGLNNLIKKMFSYVHTSNDARTVQAATQIIQQSYRDRMELISSASLISKVMRGDEASSSSSRLTDSPSVKCLTLGKDKDKDSSSSSIDDDDITLEAKDEIPADT